MSNIVTEDELPPKPKFPEGPPFMEKWFFIGFNKFFNKASDGDMIKQKDVGQLPGGMKVEKLLENFYKEHAKIAAEKPDNVKMSELSQHSDDGAQGRLEVYNGIKNLIFEDVKEATMYRVLEQFLGIVMASVFKNFVTSLKTSFAFWLLPMFWILIGLSITFARGVLDTHSKGAVARSKAKTGQVLRGLLFKSFQDMSFITLENMRPQHITKIVGYVLDGMTDWVGIWPTLIAAPITATLTFFYLTALIGWGSLYFLVIFFSFAALISTLNTINGTNAQTFFSKNVLRSQTLNEMCPNMSLVKSSGYEGYFRNRLHEARVVERKAFEKVQFINTLIDFFTKVMPVLS